MSSVDPPSYGPVVAALVEPDRLNELGPGIPNEPVRDQIAALTPEAIVAPHRVRDREMAAASLAGLWLYHNFVDESHAISQQIDTTTGSYWHGILHRREPDYANSKYWFRRAGEHPIVARLVAAARELTSAADLDAPARFLASQPAWDHFRFVDLCQAASEGRSQCEPLCRRIQLCEWRLLFEYSYRQAVG